MLTLELTFTNGLQRTFEFPHESLDALVTEAESPNNLVITTDNYVINFDNVLYFKEL
jgi:hypothetical protein